MFFCLFYFPLSSFLFIVRELCVLGQRRAWVGLLFYAFFVNESQETLSACVKSCSDTLFAFFISGLVLLLQRIRLMFYFSAYVLVNIGDCIFLHAIGFA